ncbi:carbohydrate binding family 9 domain-containing protein [Mucilaginibacter gotjawali]|uniref:Carbohydrate-binding domain-containing protein n=2 Tax=Mucilaginibacter gotjawali TaxID=1550579 RepID=A0A839SBN2_9SPHI|nr:carbohydrate binding family 9 domain-containing protein [Mucilaginibacter gotjawali]MBB3054673.1 hypothetical protein [Mucilaginibacter gotjawali]
MIKKLPFLLLFISSYAFAQDADFFKPDSIRKTVKAVKISTNIKVDGLLDEPEWLLAPASPDFIQIEPYQGKAPNFATLVKVLYNQKYLYFGITCKDPLGKKAIMASDFVRDFDYTRHDLVNLSIDAFNDKRNAMVFATNAYGVQRDLLSFDDLYYDIDWNGLWAVRTNRTDSGWTAEIAIPWKTLRYPKRADTVQSWGFNVYRNRRYTNEVTALSPFPRVFSATHMDYAGVLTNLQPPPPATNIQVDPYFLTSYDHYTNFGSAEPVHASSIKVGGDLKWAINSNSVLDLTAHTDFAQADADIQVNNITRFSVFFPEKRQFFLENASLFGMQVNPLPDGSGGSMNYQPFFSRSIGLDTAGNPIPIVAGGRFVYRSSKLNFGAIAIRQQGANDLPGTNFFVGRVSENFGSQDRVGALISVKNQPGGSNIETTVDGFFRLGESNSLNTLLTQSTTTNTGQKGFGGIMQYYNSNNHYKIWWTESVVTKNFDPQMGFVSRKDVIGTTPGINFYYRGSLLPFKSVLLAFEPGFLPELYYTASTGKFAEMDLPLFPVWLNFKSGAYFGYGIDPIRQHLTSVFQPLGVSIAPGDYSYLTHQFWASTDPSKIINLSFIYQTGSYFNGKLNSGDWKLQFAPVPYISFLGEYSRNHFEGVGENKTTTNVNLYVLRARFALNPRVQLTGIYQRNSLNNADNYNIRLSWEFLPLSYVYLIYNRGVTNMINNMVIQTQTEDHIIYKISYLQQF